MLLPTSTHVLKTFQSAYHPGDSTETALLKIVNGLFHYLNTGDCLFYLCLTFHLHLALEHSILVYRHRAGIVFFHAVLQWCSSYLTNRTQYVSFCNHCLAFASVNSDVLLGSLLGPILFTIDDTPMSTTIDSHSITCHSFAD